MAFENPQLCNIASCPLAPPESQDVQSEISRMVALAVRCKISVSFGPPHSKKTLYCDIIIAAGSISEVYLVGTYIKSACPPGDFRHLLGIWNFSDPCEIAIMARHTCPTNPNIFSQEQQQLHPPF